MVIDVANNPHENENVAQYLEQVHEDVQRVARQEQGSVAGDVMDFVVDVVAAVREHHAGRGRQDVGVLLRQVARDYPGLATTLADIASAERPPQRRVPAERVPVDTAGVDIQRRGENVPSAPALPTGQQARIYTLPQADDDDGFMALSRQLDASSTRHFSFDDPLLDWVNDGTASLDLSEMNAEASPAPEKPRLLGLEEFGGQGGPHES